MNSKIETMTGGFDEPVFQAQTVFRKLMEAMSRPGTIETIDVPVTPPAPLSPAAAAIALSLCDHETPVWLSAGLGKSAVPQWIAFHTGAPITREKSEARFAFVEPGVAIASFGLFAGGTQEYPDRSTTLIVEVAGFDSGRRLDLSGPGIQQTTTISVAGLPEHFLRQWAENRALFPRGVDVVFVSGERFLALPRTCKIAAREN